MFYIKFCQSSGSGCSAPVAVVGPPGNSLGLLVGIACVSGAGGFVFWAWAVPAVDAGPVCALAVVALRWLASCGRLPSVGGSWGRLVANT